MGFLGGGVWTKATPRGGGLGWNCPPKHPRLLGIRMSGAGVMLPTKQAELWNLFLTPLFLTTSHSYNESARIIQFNFLYKMSTWSATLILLWYRMRQPVPETRVWIFVAKGRALFCWNHLNWKPHSIQLTQYLAHSSMDVCIALCGFWHRSFPFILSIVFDESQDSLGLHTAGTANVCNNGTSQCPPFLFCPASCML